MGPARAIGKQRSFGLGLLLTIITVGIYHYYWHFVNIKESRSWLGKPTSTALLPWWILGLYLLAVVATIILGLVAKPDPFTGAPPNWAVTSGRVITGATALGIIALYAVVLGIQFYSLKEIGKMARVPLHAGPKAFYAALVLYLGGLVYTFATNPYLALFMAILLVPGTIGVTIALVITYSKLQQDYNRVWSAFARDGVPSRLPSYGKDSGETPSQHPSPAMSQMVSSHGHTPQDSLVSRRTPLAQSSSEGTSPDRIRGPHSVSRGVTPAGKVRSIRRRVVCPDCKTPISAEGAPGAVVELLCGKCGKSGRVRLAT